MKAFDCLFVVFIFLNGMTQTKAQLSETMVTQIDAVFNQCNRTDLPGCALAIVKDATIVYKKGYGMADLEHGIAIQPNTVFYAGSISKQFVASCALLLAESGRLDLEESVQIYLPDFPEYQDKITVQDLIYHVSGIKDYFELMESVGINYLNQVPRQEIYELIKSQESLDFRPGDKYSYSNSGYLMLGIIIEKVTAMPFSTFVEQEIFRPLGMTHSMFLDNVNTLIPNRAWGYDINVDDQVENMIMRFDLVGSGGLYTTVEDLFLWDQNFYDSKIGSDRFIEKLLTTGKLNDQSDTQYAFALRKDTLMGKRVIGHSGSLGGYRAQYMQFPEEKISIIILGNYANFKPGERAHDVTKILFASF